MNNYIVNESDIHIWKQKYETDKESTIEECMQEKPFCDNPKDRIEKLVFIEPNDAFKRLSEMLPKYASENKNILFSEVNTRFKFKKELRITRNIRIVCEVGYLTISIKNDGLELETIVVEKEHQGQGIGTGLMCQFFDLLIKSFEFDFPPIYLDCIGCATLGNEYIRNDVSNQCRFFRKFGFRVTNYHKTGKEPVIDFKTKTIHYFSDHAEMKLDFQKWHDDFYPKFQTV